MSTDCNIYYNVLFFVAFVETAFDSISWIDIVGGATIDVEVSLVLLWLPEKRNRARTS